MLNFSKIALYSINNELILLIKSNFFLRLHLNPLLTKDMNTAARSNVVVVSQKYDTSMKVKEYKAVHDRVTKRMIIKII